MLCLCMLLMQGVAHAGAREQAKRMHDRIAGVPPSAAVLNTMEGLLATGNKSDAISADYMAMENSSF